MRYQRTILLSGLISFTIFAWACKNSTEPVTGNALARIDLESDFQNDSVQVEFDAHTLLAGRVTTNYSISAAWMSSHLDIAAGNHVMKLTVYTDNVTNQISTYIKDMVTVAASYNRQTKQIEFHTYDFLVMRR